VVFPELLGVEIAVITSGLNIGTPLSVMTNTPELREESCSSAVERGPYPEVDRFVEAPKEEVVLSRSVDLSSMRSLAKNSPSSTMSSSLIPSAAHRRSLTAWEMSESSQTIGFVRMIFFKESLESLTSNVLLGDLNSTIETLTPARTQVVSFLTLTVRSIKGILH
jgi:hypothetical protein